MSNPYSGEWEKVNSIADSIKNLEQQIEMLESEIESCYARLSSYPVEYDEDGNDINEGVRDSIYSQISAYQAEVSNMQSQRSSLSSQAHSLAQGYGRMAAEYREKSSHHTTSAGQFNRLSGYRFGAATASAGASAAQQRATHYSDHARTLEDLQKAAQSAASGYRTNGGLGSISSRGTFHRPSSNSSAGSTASSSSAMHRSTAAAGTYTRRVHNPSTSATFAQLGISGITSQNGTPNYAPVAHDSVRLHTIRERIENLTAMADALLAVKWMQNASSIAQYRTENHVQWRMNENLGTAELVPENILNEYQNGTTQTSRPATPMEALTAYMCAHNYGQDDYGTYSQDPEWQALHQAAFPEHYTRINEQRDSRYNELQSRIDNAGIRTADFSGYVAGEVWPGKWFVAGGEHSLEFAEYFQNMESYHTQPYENEVRTIDARLIEGIDISSSDIENPSRFWRMHKDDGTKESFLQIARQIPHVQERLDAGVPLQVLLNDDKLGDCARIYFDTDSPNAASVCECDGYYVFSSNGRHRILAAQELGYRIPIRVVARYERNT